jgi:hypothetical protein
MTSLSRTLSWIPHCCPQKQQCVFTNRSGSTLVESRQTGMDYPTGNLAAAVHVYNFNGCNSISCYDSQLAPVAAAVPLTITEIGENDCGHAFIDSLMTWADAHGAGYLGWTWNTWDCSKGPALIADYTGTPTSFGAGLKSHLTAGP